MRKTYVYPCGCQISGNAPNVEHAFFCNKDECQQALINLRRQAPHSARKVETTSIIVNVATANVEVMA